MEEENAAFEFTPVSIDSFFDKSELQADSIGIGITILTKHQEMLVKKLLDVLHRDAPDRVEHLEARLRKVEKLAKDIALFPSLLERTETNTSVRTPQELVERAAGSRPPHVRGMRSDDRRKSGAACAA